MTEARGRIAGNTIILTEKPILPDGSEVVVHFEQAPANSHLRGRTREPGLMKGLIEISDDFKEIPEGFEDYT